jgi:hypothetical protein
VSLHDYLFRDTWLLDVPAHRVFDAVVDLASYPLWWPDVRSVTQVDDDTAELYCRALLPYALVVRMRRAEQDERTGRLRVEMTGDLEGYLAGVVGERTGGASLAITQKVVVRKRLLRRLAPVARPLFRLNHAVMMRRGRHGLRGYLAAEPGQ